MRSSRWRGPNRPHAADDPASNVCRTWPLKSDVSRRPQRRQASGPEAAGPQRRARLRAQAQTAAFEEDLSPAGRDRRAAATPDRSRRHAGANALGAVVLERVLQRAPAPQRNDRAAARPARRRAERWRCRHFRSIRIRTRSFWSTERRSTPACCARSFAVFPTCAGASISALVGLRGRSTRGFSGEGSPPHPDALGHEQPVLPACRTRRAHAWTRRRLRVHDPAACRRMPALRRGSVFSAASSTARSSTAGREPVARPASTNSCAGSAISGRSGCAAISARISASRPRYRTCGCSPRMRGPSSTARSRLVGRALRCISSRFQARSFLCLRRDRQADGSRVRKPRFLRRHPRQGPGCLPRRARRR